MKIKAISKKKPVIFNFQVTEIQPVRTSSEFKNWEKLMQKRVGIQMDAKSIAMASATTTCCPDCDDCDMA